MFKVQTKSYSCGKRWQDMRNGARFATEQAAWDFIASLDEDGFVDRANYRVITYS